MRSEVIGSSTSERQRKELFIELTKQSVHHNYPSDDESGSGCSSGNFQSANVQLTGSSEHSQFSPSTDIMRDSLNRQTPHLPTRRVRDDIRHMGRTFSTDTSSEEEITIVPNPAISPYDERQLSYESENTSTEFAGPDVMPLTDQELMRLEEVRNVAVAISKKPYVVTSDTKQLRPVVEAMRMQQFGVNKMIDGMSELSAFKELSVDNQTVLLKNACTEMMLLRSVMHFDPESNSWAIFANEVSKATITINSCVRIYFRILTLLVLYLKNTRPLYNFPNDLKPFVSFESMSDSRTNVMYH